MWGRRRRVRRWLDGWERIAAATVPGWSALDGDELAVLADRVERFVSRTRWEAARGFELDQEVVVTVAASAGLLAIGLDRDCYRHVRAVVVHAHTFVDRSARASAVRGVVTEAPQRLLGHARDGQGPVMLSWSAVRRDVRAPHRGQNVVVHELAHKLDAAAGLFDGTPEITDRADRAEWVQVCNREYRRLRRRREPDPVLRPYATTNPAEFFAVASEVFLTRPVDLEEHHPELYGVLVGHYGQDPAERLRRATGPA